MAKSAEVVHEIEGEDGAEEIWRLRKSSEMGGEERREGRERKREGRNEREIGEAEIKREGLGERRKEEREGRGSPLRREKERGDRIIFHRHYFSLARAEERDVKGGAGEGKELSLTRARMRGGEKESGREGEKIFPPLARMHARARRRELLTTKKFPSCEGRRERKDEEREILATEKISIVRVGGRERKEARDGIPIARENVGERSEEKSRMRGRRKEWEREEEKPLKRGRKKERRISRKRGKKKERRISRKRGRSDFSLLRDEERRTQERDGGAERGPLITLLYDAIFLSREREREKGRGEARASPPDSPRSKIFFHRERDRFAEEERRQRKRRRVERK